MQRNLSKRKESENVGLQFTRGAPFPKKLIVSQVRLPFFPWEWPPVYGGGGFMGKLVKLQALAVVVPFPVWSGSSSRALLDHILVGFLHG